MATDDTDEGANVAEFRTGVVRMEEDKVLEEVPAEDVLQVRSGA